MNVIKSGREITKLFEQGRRASTKDLNFIIARCESQHDREGRVAFIAGKKHGNAVWRNRAKRRMRGLCRDLGGPFEGYDIIFLAKKGINEAPYSLLKDRAVKALQKQHVLS